jgi:RimJ/RimL family protein N-acetyltransferase
MPQTGDRERIRRILARDRGWSVYALGDLSPVFFSDCRWWVSADNEALLLLYGRGEAPVLFTCGAASAVAPLLDEAAPDEALLSVPEDMFLEIQRRAEVEDPAQMLRMTLGRGVPLQAPFRDDLRRVTMADIDALERLFGDGRETGEVPDFFRLSMVSQGVFFGVWEGPELVAVAGTHVTNPEEGVGAIGNVYTRRDRRGRGLAGAAVAAVSTELRRQGIDLIALNVDPRNEPAVRAYRRVGFQPHCHFFEGHAVFRPETCRQKP